MTGQSIFSSWGLSVGYYDLLRTLFVTPPQENTAWVYWWFGAPEAEQPLQYKRKGNPQMVANKTYSSIVIRRPSATTNRSIAGRR